MHRKLAIFSGSLNISAVQMTLLAQNLGGLSLAFPAGCRPQVSDVLRLSDSAPFSNFPYSIGHCHSSSDGLLEVLAAGLAFDLCGLSPAISEPMPDIAHYYGLPDVFEADAYEVVTLHPGAHLAGGENLLPVVRAMVGVASVLTALPGAAAVIWHPARTAIGPANFARMVAGWLAGGAFPALGLTALQPTPEGGLISEGLAFFTGQELRIEPISGMDMSGLGKIAVRLIHRMVESAKVAVPCDLIGPHGELLRAEPINGGRVLRVWKRG